MFQQLERILFRRRHALFGRDTLKWKPYFLIPHGFCSRTAHDGGNKPRLGHSRCRDRKVRGFTGKRRTSHGTMSSGRAKVVLWSSLSLLLLCFSVLHQMTLPSLSSVSALDDPGPRRDSKSSAPTVEPRGRGPRNKIVFFLHFHKAGGTSVSSAFGRHLRAFPVHVNGNPWQIDDEPHDLMRLVQFWKYNVTELSLFLDDLERRSVQFVAFEWNFFQFPLTPAILRRVDIVTCFREPYERFRSNLFVNQFRPEYGTLLLSFAICYGCLLISVIPGIGTSTIQCNAPNDGFV